MNKKTRSSYAMPTVVQKLLDIDPLGEAELKTGQSYKDDKATMALGILELQDRRRHLDEMLAMNDDTRFSNEVKNYVRIVKSEGFKLVLEVPFESREGNKEAMFVFWNPQEFLLLVCDTYGGRNTDINSASLYFNWVSNKKECVFPPHASGGMGSRTDENDFTFSGHHDAREAFRFRLWWLRVNGSFVRWEYVPHLWLIHHGDTRGKYDYNAIMQERISLLPDEVRDVICLTSNK